MQTARLPKAIRKAKHARDKADAQQDLYDPKLYINRELSLLSFQRRVLEEALDEANPLLERVKFLSILGSNLDEFFMVRVAGLIEQVEAGISEPAPDGMSPSSQLIAIRREVRRLLSDAHKCLAAQLLPALDENGIHVVDYDDLSEAQRAAANEYFRETVFPILTPLAFDPARPFPHISNLSLNLAVVIADASGVQHFARVKTPGSLPQVVLVSRRKSGKRNASRRIDTYVWLEQVIAANLGALFPGLTVLESHAFHVTRDADIDIKELEAEDLLETVEEGVRQRRFGSVIRLEVHHEMPRHILTLLMQNMEVTSKQVYRIKGLLGLSRLLSLYQIDRPDLKYKTFVPRLPPELEPAVEGEDIFGAIRRNDVLVHHPFDSFQPVIDLLERSARDPDVLAIKIVLYRVGRNSPVVQALLDAAEEGKQVAVLMELKARFDEESNIEWARALERAGVHVVYGLLGLKSHCKVALIVRREGDRIRRYVHLATGNYNAVTAHLYTDIGLFTVDEDLASDATDLFNYLTGYSLKNDYRKMLVSPLTLRAGFERLVQREIEHQKGGRGGRLILKMNSLVDGRVIRLLYRASQAGVDIDLLVRGMCCLRPQVPGVSENIRVTSVVGRFLEHSRIYYFRNGGEEEIYLGSADLMPRNLDRRVEVLFPLCSEKLRDRLKRVLDLYLRDNVKARRMNSAGAYMRRPLGKSERPVNAQEELIPWSLSPAPVRAAILQK
jgi:polyphosphate kinase